MFWQFFLVNFVFEIEIIDTGYAQHLKSTVSKFLTLKPEVITIAFQHE